MKIAFMFSGQGSQKVGMGLELYNNYPSVKKVFDESDTVLDFKITDICFKENDLINKTDYTQPCLLTTSTAIHSLFLEEGIEADYLVGLSLGEYTALVASGALDFKEAVNLVNKRGQFMNKAVENLSDTGMYAILSSTEEVIKDAISKVEGVVEIANYNSKKQIVIAGEKAPLVKVVEILKEQKVKAIPLNVSGPFHTSLLEEASINLNKELQNIEIKKLTKPVVANLTAKEVSEEEIKDSLTKQVMNPVLWEQTVNYLISQGVDTFVEIGPGKTLCSFVKSIDKSVKLLNVEDKESFEKTIEYLKGN